MTPREFYDVLDTFNWDYRSSDTFEEWKRGFGRHIQIIAKASEDSKLAALYDQWEQYVWNRGPKPEYPKK